MPAFFLGVKMIKHRNYAKAEIVNIFVEAFMGDDAYISLYPDEVMRRKVLKPFFRAYLTMLQDSCHLWSENGCYALIYDPDKAVNKWRSYYNYYLGYLRGFKIAFLESKKRYDYLLRTILYEGSDWLDDLTNYIHLDMLVVSPKDKGRGFGKKMMLHVFAEAEKRGKTITLETQTANNRDMYLHLGFSIYKEIPHESYTEYCMIKIQK